MADLFVVTLASSQRRVLERSAYDRLTDERPSLAIVLLEGIIGLQSERRAFASRQTAMPA